MAAIGGKIATFYGCAVLVMVLLAEKSAMDHFGLYAGWLASGFAVRNFLIPAMDALYRRSLTAFQR